MATYSFLPSPEEPGGLPSMGLHRVRHDWSNLAAAAAVWKTIADIGYMGINWYSLSEWQFGHIYYSFLNIHSLTTNFSVWELILNIRVLGTEVEDFYHNII